ASLRPVARPRLRPPRRSPSSTEVYANVGKVHSASDNHTGGRGADASCRSWGSVFRQQLEPLPFGQMTWRDHLKVPAVKSGDLVQVEPLGERYYASIHGLEPQRRVGGEQFSHPPVVMRRDLNDAELV